MIAVNILWFMAYLKQLTVFRRKKSNIICIKTKLFRALIFKWIYLLTLAHFNQLKTQEFSIIKHLTDSVAAIT